MPLFWISGVASRFYMCLPTLVVMINPKYCYTWPVRPGVLFQTLFQTPHLWEQKSEILKFTSESLLKMSTKKTVVCFTSFFHWENRGFSKPCNFTRACFNNKNTRKTPILPSFEGMMTWRFRWWNLFQVFLKIKGPWFRAGVIKITPTQTMHFL